MATETIEEATQRKLAQVLCELENSSWPESKTLMQEITGEWKLQEYPDNELAKQMARVKRPSVHNSMCTKRIITINCSTFSCASLKSGGPKKYFKLGWHLG